MYIEDKVKLDCYNRGYEKGREDTAKDIISWLENKDKQGMTRPFNLVLRQLKYRYGLEVE